MAPRSPSVGAPAHREVAAATAAATLLAACAIAVGPAAAQQPPRPPTDTVPARDTTRLPVPLRRPVPGEQVPPDTVRRPSRRLDIAPADTLRGDTAAVVDTAVAPPALPAGAPGRDTLQAPADTLGPVPSLPGFPEPVPAGWASGVWEWEREDLMREGSLTLGSLVRDLPGIVHLRGGHVGMPEAVSAFALGAGRVRVFLDGFELDPLDGRALDLSLVKLAGLDRVRVERRAGELRIHVSTLAPFDHRPYSLVDAGTGDLETTYFRGVLAHPRGLGGSLAVGIDRFDTEGTARAQPASGFTTWLKYGLLQGQRGGVQLEWRRHRAERDTLFAPSSITRSDLILRARGMPAQGVHLDAFVGRSSVSGEDPATDNPVQLSGRQAGARLAVEGGGAWARAGLRLRDARGLPGTAIDLAAGARLGRWLEADGDVEWEDWGRETSVARHARVAAAPFPWLRAFAEYDGGRRGIPFAPAADTAPEASAEFAKRTTRRMGAELRHGGLALGAAALHLDVDSLRPLGFGPDSLRVVTPGGQRSGFEVSARVPLLPPGLRVQGVWQEWSGQADWPYLPQRIWSASLIYHRTFLATGNLELLASVGARGRPAMLLPLPDPADPDLLAMAPPFESWSMYLQIRVVTVRIFLAWENLTNRLDQRDFARRLLPGQHALYGVRWVMWN